MSEKTTSCDLENNEIFHKNNNQDTEDGQEESSRLQDARK